MAVSFRESVTVKIVDEVPAIPGVPLMRPAFVSVSPVGSALFGETVAVFVPVPPPNVRFTTVIALPTVPEIEAGPEIVGRGFCGGELIIISKAWEALPDALVAVIVYVLEDADVVGVPEINPVAVLKESPGVFEIAGEIEKLVIAPPVGVMVYPEIEVPAVAVSDAREMENAGGAKAVIGKTAVITPEFKL